MEDSISPTFTQLSQWTPSTQEAQEAQQQPKRLFVAPLLYTLSADEVEAVGTDALELFLQLRRGPDSFVMQCPDPRDTEARLSLLGTEPLFTLRTRSAEQGEVPGTVEAEPVAHLEQHLERFVVPREWQRELSWLNGCAVGYIGFDAVRQFEPRLQAVTKPRDELGIPESIMLFCSTLVCVEHSTGRISIVALCALRASGGVEEAAYAAAVQRIGELLERLKNKAVPVVADDAELAAGGESVSNQGEEGYRSFVRKLKERIVAGDVVQTVPSHRMERSTPAHPFNVHRALCNLNPSRYNFYMEFEGDIRIVGASPELLVSVRSVGTTSAAPEGEGLAPDKTVYQVETHPIAGTRRRGKDVTEDKELAADLMADHKELAEHIMLVDLGRNDVNRVCLPESVRVPTLMEVQYFSHVMHIVSVVQGELRSSCTPFDAFRSVFPAGTVSGAPKVMALEHIYNLEGERRGIYAGAVGQFSLVGDLDTCISIRTILFLGSRAMCQAGGGIVLDSDEGDEWRETLAKMGAPLAALDAAEKSLHRGPATPVDSVSVASVRHNASLAFETSGPTHVSIPRSLGAAPSKGGVIMIDNYDSFTWNVYQLLAASGRAVTVFRNDQVSVQQCIELEPSHVVLSPGPCDPSSAGECAAILKHFAGKVPVLGVCLGHEVIVEVYGGKIASAGEIRHGKTSKLAHDSKWLYSGVTPDIDVIRYHSLAAEEQDLLRNAPDLEITSRTKEAPHIVMGVRHKKFAVAGVQFHPESIATKEGVKMIENFLSWDFGEWPANVKGARTILQRIVDRTKSDLAARAEEKLDELKRRAAEGPALLDVVARLRAGNAVLGEVKRASPSKGDIFPHADAVQFATTYAEGGAAVVSVLTEPHWFKGTLEDLRQVRRALERFGDARPGVLRKDFIVDARQVYEARAAGADCVLLIVACLSEEELSSLVAVAREVGMEPLVEAANREEMKTALAAGARLIGVNARDLHTFGVDVQRAADIIAFGRQHASEGSDPIFVGLSGVSSRVHVEQYLKAGASGALVGESLMRAPSPARLLQRLRGQQLVPLVKVCGVCSVSDALHAAQSGADMIGLIFAEQSKRRVLPATAADIAREVRALGKEQPSELALSAALKKSKDMAQYAEVLAAWRERVGRPLLVGVFTDHSEATIRGVLQRVELDVIQLSGKCEHFGAEQLPFRKPLFRALHVAKDSTAQQVKQQIASGSQTALGRNTFFVPLLDTYHPKQHGGTGETFSWDVGAQVQRAYPLVAAGGLNADNVAEAVRTIQPWAVDVASGVESSPGVKDAKRVAAFVKAAKSALE